ncbi:MAG: DUF4349 domain-containing protein [Deltaproteobacteria bacterium]
MRCEACRELLSPYLDEVCSEKENKMIQAHLAACAGCRDQLQEMRRMVELLHHMTLPSLPEGFAESLHRRLDAENLIMFTPHEFKVPRKQSWIAAAIAGVALAGGVYASTVLPLGSMIASWQEKSQDAGKPKVAINEVLKQINNQESVNTAANDAAGQVDQKPAGKTDRSEQIKSADNAKVAATAVDTGKSSGSTAQNGPRLADATAVRLTVANAAESRNQVIQIAAANSLGYSYNNNGCMQALSGPTAQGVTLKVEPKDVDKVMQQLAALGQAGKPSQSTIDMTEQFQDVQTQMDQVRDERAKLVAKAVPSSQELNRLNELKAEMQSLTDKKARLEKEASLVTINVYFIEAVNP